MRLIVQHGVSKGKEFDLVEGENLVGRRDLQGKVFPQVDLEDDDTDAKVSRRHAILVRRGSNLTIQDIGSLNGTFINRGPRLEKGVEHELKPGDEIIVGRTLLKLEMEG